MAERLGLAVIPGVGWSADETQAIAREAEEAGFDAIFTTEVNSDVMATAQLMGAATSRIHVGTWIANIYLRHSYICAQGAALIADATGGRFILGLGVSHEPINDALGINMPHPLKTLRHYVSDVRKWLRGEGPATHLPQRPTPRPVPIYVAALREQAVELGGEVADGLMGLFWTVDWATRSKTWAARGRESAPQLGPLDMTLGLPTFIGADQEVVYEVARQNLVLYTVLPHFQRLIRDMGFAEEAALMEQGNGLAGLTGRVLESICLMGPVEHCRERLMAYRDAGVDLPILYPSIGVDAARQAIHAFGR